jgi:hypothetical protein
MTDVVGITTNRSRGRKDPLGAPEGQAFAREVWKPDSSAGQLVLMQDEIEDTEAGSSQRHGNRSL